MSGQCRSTLILSSPGITRLHWLIFGVRTLYHYLRLIENRVINFDFLNLKISDQCITRGRTYPSHDCNGDLTISHGRIYPWKLDAANIICVAKMEEILDSQQEHKCFRMFSLLFLPWERIWYMFILYAGRIIHEICEHVFCYFGTVLLLLIALIVVAPCIVFIRNFHGSFFRYVKLRDAKAPGLPWTFPRYRGLAIPTCITARVARAVMHAGIANSRFPLKSVAGETVPIFPALVHSTILRIW